MMYTVKYNGETAAEHGLLVANRPNIPSAVEDVTTYSVSGRDGDLHRHEGTVKDISIKITFNYISSPELWGTAFRNATQWLYGREDMRLFLGDDDGWFYKVKNVVVSEAKRQYKKIGNFTATFTCEGYAYSLEGQYKTDSLVLYNPYSVSHPVYHITGEGVCEIAVNGKSMTANVGQNLVIDTDKCIAYRVDGTMMNTAVTGDYENLYFQEGQNVVTVTDGFTVTVVPGWRCRT
ncbi:MAG: phage tail protein [Lachnospiraceae bacterium]|nr:phage tail protein [Lachnospiraceae bacterium]